MRACRGAAGDDEARPDDRQQRRDAGERRAGTVCDRRCDDRRKPDPRQRRPQAGGYADDGRQGDCDQCTNAELPRPSESRKVGGGRIRRRQTDAPGHRDRRPDDQDGTDCASRGAVAAPGDTQNDKRGG